MESSAALGFCTCHKCLVPPGAAGQTGAQIPAHGAEQGHRAHGEMKNASFTPTECLLSCLRAHAVFWHDAFSSGRRATRNTSTSLCQTPPAAQGAALWWPGWQWQTDNGWMLHFTFLTFLSKCISFFIWSTPPPPPHPPKNWLSRREEEQTLTKRNHFWPLEGLFTWRHMGWWYEGHVTVMLLKDTWPTCHHGLTLNLSKLEWKLKLKEYRSSATQF